MEATLPAGGPVDEFGRVEETGIEAIPPAARHGRARELGFLWGGAFVNYASLLTASLLTTYYGLGVWDGLAATALGTVAGAVILGLLSNTGPASGLPQIVFTERVFGRAGVRVGAALTLFLAVGWFAVDCVIAAQAGVQLLSVSGVPGASRSLLPWVLVIAAVSVAVAVYGHRTIKVFETFGALLFGALAVVLFALLAPQMHWSAGPSAAGADYPGAFVLGFMTCFALVASWYPFASDYSRYLPAGTSPRAVTFWPVAGVAVPMLVLGLFGLLIPTIDARLAADQGPLAVITQHAPLAVAAPFLAFVVLGEIWANYLDVYTAGLVALALGIRLRRWQTAALCGGAGFLLAAAAVVVTDFHVAYEDFLVLTYLWAPAWAGVVLIAWRRRGPIAARAAAAAWAAGTVASLLFVNYGNLFGNVSKARFPNQPMIDALHGADLSGAVSVAVAAAVFALAARPRRA